MLTRLTDDGDLLDGIFELDNATNDRLLAESGLLPGIDARELVFGIPSYRIINAAFCHPAPDGSRFNSADRGAWYAGFELETSQAEVAYHKQLWLQETEWNEEEIADYVDYRADFRAEFHDIRGTKEYSRLSLSNQLCCFAGTRCPASGGRLRGNCVSQRPPLWWNLHRVFSAGVSDERSKG